MGRLKRAGLPDFRELTAETSVGRAAGAGLRLTHSHVSLQHASLRWTERKTWELRDLQSKNGTFVNGQRVPAGSPVKLELGAELTFGAADDRWLVEDVSPPRPMLVRLDGEGEPIFLMDSFIGLPSLEEPTVSLFRGENGQWSVDSRERVGPLADGDLLVIGTEHWRCCLPTTPDETELVGGAAGLFTLAELELELEVSRDEEDVALTLRGNGRDIRLGQKACHYLLLTLARCRLGGETRSSRRVSANAEPMPSAETPASDRGREPPDRDLQAPEGTADGWIGVATLLDLLRVSEQRLNVDIFRIRQELKTAGVVDAIGIIERDTQERRVRLGTAHVVVRSRVPAPSVARPSR
jgi:hypothetical protein